MIIVNKNWAVIGFRNALSVSRSETVGDIAILLVPFDHQPALSYWEHTAHNMQGILNVVHSLIDATKHCASTYVQFRNLSPVYTT